MENNQSKKKSSFRSKTQKIIKDAYFAVQTNVNKIFKSTIGITIAILISGAKTALEYFGFKNQHKNAELSKATRDDHTNILQKISPFNEQLNDDGREEIIDKMEKTGIHPYSENYITSASIKINEIIDNKQKNSSARHRKRSKK